MYQTVGYQVQVTNLQWKCFLTHEQQKKSWPKIQEKGRKKKFGLTNVLCLMLFDVLYQLLSTNKVYLLTNNKLCFMMTSTLAPKPLSFWQYSCSWKTVRERMKGKKAFCLVDYKLTLLNSSKITKVGILIYRVHNTCST